ESLLLLLISLSVSSAIMCYVCNSEYKSDCWENYEKFITGCSDKRVSGQQMKAIGCRTIRTSVGDERSLVRECAYTGENVDNKVTRGTNKLVRSYTQCSTHKCNSSSSLFSIISFGIVALFAFSRW
ncbi:hypothetical protein PFISCL1PPCAC_15292, partial [Pristionchus fissidentatus]